MVSVWRQWRSGPIDRRACRGLRSSHLPPSVWHSGPRDIRADSILSQHCFAHRNPGRDQDLGSGAGRLFRGPMSLAQQGIPDVFIQFAPIIFIGLIFYLLIFMPMKKKQKKLDAMIAALKSGDKVITNAGIYGVVAGVKERTLILKVADQVKIEIAKNAVAGLQSPEES